MTELLQQLESGSSSIRVTHAWFKIEDFEIFARELRDIETVEKVFLTADQLNDQMTTLIAESLKHNRSIKELFLSENNIGDTGAKALGDALKQNRTLELLYLNENRIGISGAEALLEGLKANHTLKRLFMLRNPLTIDSSFEYKLSLRLDYARMLALCSLSVPRLAKNSNVFALPNDVLRVVRLMLSDEWQFGYSKRQS